MRRFALPALLVGTLVLAGPVHSALLKGPAAPAPAQSGVIQWEPVVVYNLTGGTLTGTLHRQLTVYNNGFATIAQFDMPVFPTPGEIKDVATTSVGSDAAFQLLIDLVVAGAGTLPDQQIPFSDTPLKTLTVLQGQQLALSRTISWYGGFGYTDLDIVVNTFIADNFPGFGGGSPSSS